jgi:hypothetical protein
MVLMVFNDTAHGIRNRGLASLLRRVRPMAIRPDAGTSTLRRRVYTPSARDLGCGIDDV